MNPRPLPHLLLGCLTAALCLALPGSAAAGGWTQPQGGHYLKVWLRGLVGSHAILHTGDNEDIGRTYQDYALNFYAEYGLTDAWTAVALGRPFGFASLDDSTAYVGNVLLGIRRALLQGTWNLALEARYGYAPDIGTESLGSGVVAGQPYIYAPTVESHIVDGELQLGVGFPHGWVAAAAAFRWLSGDGLDPVIMGDAHVGYSFDAGVDLDLYAAAYQPIDSVVFTNVSGAGQTRFIGFGLDVSYWIVPAWSINAGVGGIFTAESNAATPAITLGFAHRYGP